MTTRTDVLQVKYVTDGDGNVKASLASTAAGLKQVEAAEKSAGIEGKLLGAALGGAVVAGLVAIVEATVAVERSQAQLDAVLASTGQRAGYNRDQLLQMAEGLSQVSTFSSETAVSAETMLLQFRNIGQDVFPKVLTVSADLATRLGVELPDAARLLGQALDAPVKGLTLLRRAHIDLSDAQQESIKNFVATGQIEQAQKIILDELTTSYGGAAAAATETLGGALAQLKNSVAELLGAGAGSDGMRGAVASIHDLSNELNDPTLREGMAATISDLAQLAGLATTAAANIGVFFHALTQNSTSNKDAIGIKAEEATISSQIDAIDTYGRVIAFMGGVTKSKDDLLAQLRVDEAALKSINDASNQPVAKPGQFTLNGEVHNYDPVGGAQPHVSDEDQKKIDAIHEQTLALGELHSATLARQRDEAIENATTGEAKTALRSEYDALIAKTKAQESEAAAAKAATAAHRSHTQAVREDAAAAEYAQRTITIQASGYDAYEQALAKSKAQLNEFINLQRRAGSVSVDVAAAQKAVNDELERTVAGQVAEALGPVEQENLRYVETLRQIDSLHNAGRLSATQYATALKQAAKAHLDASEAAKRELNPIEALQRDTQFEIQLLGESNDQKEIEIELRKQNTTASSAEGQVIIATLQHRQAAEKEYYSSTLNLLKQQVDHAKGTFDPIAQNFAQAFNTGFDALGRFIAGGLRDYKSFAQSMKDMTKQLVAQLIAYYLKLWAIKLITQFVSGGSGNPVADSEAAQMPGFANGGVMSDQGPLPLNHYATGGIADHPQIAIFAEGRMKEAYVPLADGRSIPVTMHGGGNGGGNVYVQVINNGDQSVKTEQSTSGADKLIRIVIGEVAKDISRGGATAQAVQARFGTQMAPIKYG